MDDNVSSIKVASLWNFFYCSKMTLTFLNKKLFKITNIA